VTIPEAARELRLLAKHGETLQSHYLHLFFLAAPDFLGLPSALPLMEQAPAVFHRALHLKGLANRVCDVVAGRTTHPLSLQVGGWPKCRTRRTFCTSGRNGGYLTISKRWSSCF
jgi:coenzyme F420-reducing hydrogenase alpha subunit